MSRAELNRKYIQELYDTFIKLSMKYEMKVGPPTMHVQLKGQTIEAMGNKFNPQGVFIVWVADDPTAPKEKGGKGVAQAYAVGRFRPEAVMEAMAQTMGHILNKHLKGEL